MPTFIDRLFGLVGGWFGLVFVVVELAVRYIYPLLFESVLDVWER